ncbi:MAG: tetratricopeptide repeat protein [Candidatus Sulfotelmatobacter sp.]
MNSRIRLVVSIVGLLLLCSCSHDPNVAKQKYLQSGQRYFDKGEYGRASIQFRKALQIDRQYAEAYYRLGLTDIKLQLWPDAVHLLDQATTLDPNNVPAHLRLGELELSARQWEDARQQAGAALKLDPNNVDAYVLSGQVEFRSSHFPEAVRAFQQAERLAPKDSRVQAGLGEVNVVLQQYPQAEAHYLRAIELDPSFVPTYLNLAELYRMENQPDSTVRVLRQAMSANPKVATGYMALATFYLGRGEKAGIDSVFHEFRTANGDSTEALLSISDFYLKTDESAQAKKVIEEILIRDPKNDDARKLLVMAELKLRNWDAAENVNSELLAHYPKDPECRLASAQLLLARGKTADAVATLQALVSDVPDMAMAHFVLAMAYRQTGNAPRAIESLKDSVAHDGDFLPGYLALADFYLQKQDGKTAISYADEALRRNPRSVVGRIDHANAQLLLGDLAHALEEFTLLEASDPKSPILQERHGYIAMRQKNFAQAEQRFNNALEKQADFLPAMRDLVELYSTQKQPEKAIARLQQQLQKAPAQSDFYELLGNTYIATQQWGAAEQAFRSAIDQNQNAYLAHSQLARLYARDQKFPQALAEAQTLTHGMPEILSGYIILGSIYEQKGAVDQARATYEQAIQRDPNFAPALNNLAWIYCEHGGNLDLALSLAQRAKQNQPDDPEVSDTLAWIEYRKGLYGEAAGLLRDALRQVPDSSLFQYHLGMVLLKTGKESEAKPILARALSSNLSPTDAAEARSALQ